MFDFSHPGALWGLFTAATPIVIYLLLRRRKKEIPWGASYLLRRTLASKRKASVWKQYVVLAMRCLALALMAFLISEPFRPRPQPDLSTPSPPPRPLHRVILVDHSLSMSVSSGHASRMSRLKSVVRSLLASQRPGDATRLISMVDPEDALAAARFEGLMKPAAIESALDSMAMREGVVELSAALASGLKWLADSPDAAAEFYLLSDFPRQILQDTARLQWFRQAAAARNIRVIPVNMVDSAEGNPGDVALLDATFATDVAVARIPLTLHLLAANHGDAQAAARVRLEGRRLPPREETLILKPDESRRVPIEVTFAEAGAETLSIQVSPSRLKAASQISVSVEVKPRLVVWLLADAPDPTRPDTLGEAEFLRRAALEPDGQASSLELTEVELLQLTKPIPDTVDVLVIAGPRVITPPVRDPLLHFVRRGGGLIVAMSPALDPSFYNPNLEGLLPAAIAAPARAQVDPEAFQNIRLVAAEGDPTLFSEFAADPGGELAEARFYNYMHIEGAASAPSAAILHLTDHQPLLLEKRIHRGHALLLTSSLGISWSSLPVRQSYLPFLFRLLNAAGRGRGFTRNLATGQPFVALWPAREEVTLTSPGSGERKLGPTESAGRPFVVVEGLEERGPYSLSGPSGHVESFTVRGKPPEADLRTLDARQKKELESALGAPVYPDWPTAVSALGPSHPSARLWPWILLALLGLYLLETWFVRYL